jgi:PEP-CTERM motif
MKFAKTLLASVALAAVSFGAQAQVTGSLGGGSGTFLLLSSPALCTMATPCSLTGSVTASIVGGTILNSDQPFADIPKGAIAGGNFLSAGPTTTQASTVTLSSGVDYISFLWGSPDTYNTLTVVTDAGNVSFTAAGLGFSVTNGDQSFSQYVQFVADANVDIKGLIFSNLPSQDAFEVANFSVTAPVPEPETYALMLAGLGAVGFISRRRRRTA